MVMRKTTKILSELPLSMPRFEFQNSLVQIIMKSFKTELLIYSRGHGSGHMPKILNRASFRYIF